MVRRGRAPTGRETCGVTAKPDSQKRVYDGELIDLTLEQCASESEAIAQAWPDFLDGPPPADLDRAVAYRNSKGEPWTSTVGDILTHVVTHSAYHRGQVASELRAAGFEPAYTDFIHAVRQGFLPVR